MFSLLTYKDEDQAIFIANDHDCAPRFFGSSRTYADFFSLDGLAASVFSNNTNNAHRMAEQINAGMG